jgi:hypothetical protein
MDTMLETVLDFAVPASVITFARNLSLQPNDTAGSTVLNTNSLFTITEDDFAEMAKFTCYAQELRHLTDPFFLGSRRFIGMVGGPFDSGKRNKAMELHRNLEQCVHEIFNGSSQYFVLCRRMKGLCTRIDELTEWYIAEADSVSLQLDDIVHSGHKYGKVTELFEKCGRDIKLLTDFFNKWSEIAADLGETAKSIEMEYKVFNDFFHNDLPSKIDYIPPHIEQLADIFKNDGFVQFMGALSNQYNGILAMLHSAKITSKCLPKPALYHMVIYLGHIGTYYNDVQTKIISAKDTFLNAENAESVRILSGALKHSKESWLLSEKVSQTFLQMSEKYIR